MATTDDDKATSALYMACRLALSAHFRPGTAGGDSSAEAGCPTPVSAQIASLAALQHGWLDEAGTPYDRTQLRWLDKLLSAVMLAFSLPTPYVYPAPHGLVRAEWSTPEKEVVSTFDLANQSAEVMAARDLDAIYEHVIDFKEAGAEAQFGRFLSGHLA